MSLKQMVTEQMKNGVDPLIVVDGERTLILPQHEIKFIDIESEKKVTFYLSSFCSGGIYTITLTTPVSTCTMVETPLPEPTPVSTCTMVETPLPEPTPISTLSGLDYVI